MRSFGPLPLTLERSTPSSRAKARTEGEAWARLNASLSTGAADGALVALAGAGAAAVGCGDAGAATVDSAFAEGVGAASAAPPLASSVSIAVPSLTLSPTLTFRAFTIPAEGAGTSIVALSDSSVMSGSSAFTESPSLTKTSMIGTSLKSPISGTLTTVVPEAPSAAAGAARGGGLAGSGVGASFLGGAD